MSTPWTAVLNASHILAGYVRFWWTHGSGSVWYNVKSKREKAHRIRRQALGVQVGTPNTCVALMSSSPGRAFHTLHFFLVRTLRAGGSLVVYSSPQTPAHQCKHKTSSLVKSALRFLLGATGWTIGKDFDEFGWPACLDWSASWFALRSVRRHYAPA